MGLPEIVDLVDFAEFTELVRVLPKGENLGLSKIMMVFRQKAVEERRRLTRQMSEEERERRLAAVHSGKHAIIALCREEAASHVVKGQFELAIPAAQYALLQQLLPGEIQDPTVLEMGVKYEEVDSGAVAARKKGSPATAREQGVAASVQG